MPLRSLVSSSVLAGLAALSLLAPTTARAQSLIDFLWGGSQEWGGERQTVSFDPKYTPGQIIVSFGDRRLYLITRKGEATSYPIAVPREQSRWQGTTAVSAKRENPSWRPTPDMIKENPKLPSWVPGGHPMNPLGVRAMYLGSSTYRIHGTDAPWTIGQAVSKGCIRMTNEDVLDLYPRVPVGMRVTVTWERFSSNQSVASSDYNGPSSASEPTSYNDVPQGLQPTTYASKPAHHTVRSLPPLPESVREAQTAAVRMEPATHTSTEKTDERKAAKAEKAEAKPAKSEAKTAEKSVDKPEKTEKPAKLVTASHAPEVKPGASTKADTEKTSGTPAQSSAAIAVEAAKRAAAAAAKAAEAARQAAEAAKKAAEDAKKATSPDAPKSAAL